MSCRRKEVRSEVIVEMAAVHKPRLRQSARLSVAVSLF